MVGWGAAPCYCCVSLQPSIPNMVYCRCLAYKEHNPHPRLLLLTQSALANSPEYFKERSNYYKKTALNSPAISPKLWVNHSLAVKTSSQYCFFFSWWNRRSSRIYSIDMFVQEKLQVLLKTMGSNGPIKGICLDQRLEEKALFQVHILTELVDYWVSAGYMCCW